jgi:hypothetical protein
MAMDTTGWLSAARNTPVKSDLVAFHGLQFDRFLLELKPCLHLLAFR